MSLIYFHIFLMLAGIAFFLFFGIWELGNFVDTNKTFDFIAGIVSFVFSTALLCYLAWFIKKKKPLMTPPPACPPPKGGGISSGIEERASKDSARSSQAGGGMK